jgi:hypothetical protein
MDSIACNTQNSSNVNPNNETSTDIRNITQFISPRYLHLRTDVLVTGADGGGNGNAANGGAGTRENEGAGGNIGLTPNNPDKGW